MISLLAILTAPLSILDHASKLAWLLWTSRFAYAVLQAGALSTRSVPQGAKGPAGKAWGCGKKALVHGEGAFAFTQERILRDSLRG